MKKNFVIAALVVGIASLGVKHVRLDKDFRILAEINKQNDELVSLARRVAFDRMFDDIVKHY